MKRIIAYTLVAMLLAAASSLQAEGECDTDSLGESIHAQLGLLDEDPIGAFTRIIELALAGLHSCSDDHYTFNNNQGAQPVLGPLSLSEGYYVITMTTEGTARVEGIALEGCGKDLDGTIHNLSATQAIRGAENLVEVESDCTFYLELSKITAPWELTIEKVR